MSNDSLSCKIIGKIIIFCIYVNFRKIFLQVSLIASVIADEHIIWKVINMVDMNVLILSQWGQIDKSEMFYIPLVSTNVKYYSPFTRMPRSNNKLFVNVSLSIICLNNYAFFLFYFLFILEFKVGADCFSLFFFQFSSRLFFYLKFFFLISLQIKFM